MPTLSRDASAPARWLALLAILALALALPSAQPASAGVVPATITVTTTTINDDPNDGKCSLYEALSATFQSKAYHECSAGSDLNLIVFGGAAAGGTITFPAKPNDIDLPMINQNVAILGPITLDGNGAHTDQHIFRIAPNGTLSLTNMVLQNAHTSGGGGAILDNNFGTLNIAGVSFIGNVAEGDGGAINSNGSVNILTSNFVGNKALGVANGGISSATGYGGAIHMDGSDKLKLAASNLSGNVADKGGGALHFDAQSAELSDVIFSGNIVNGTGSDDKAPKGGGAIYNAATTTMSVLRTAFSGNLTPTSNGGAFYNQISATAIISSTSFNGNIAASTGNSAAGGAIYNGGGHLAVSRSTFLNNAVVLGNGGAIANDRHGDADISNSSFTANAAANGNGGALHNSNTQQGGPASSVVGKNDTFSANAAINASGHGGAIFAAQGHDISLGNTIVDGSVGDNCTGTISSLGHNLDSAATCGFSQAGDLNNANPQLDTPAFNGGPIVSLLTQKLKAGSAALDAGDAAMCSAAPVSSVDQRGDPRPKGPSCDIGSFEADPFVAGYGSTPVQPGPLDFGSAVAGSGTADVNFSIFETGNATLQVSNPQISGANASDFSIKSPSPFPLSIADGGVAQSVTLTCAPSAAGPRSATLGLDTNDPAHAHVSYSLVCVGTTLPQPAFGSKPVAPGPIDLGSTTINTSVSASFLISDTGDAALHVSGPALGGANPGDFALLTGGFPLTIAPNAKQTLTVQCTPTGLGIRTATLSFTTDDPGHTAVSFNLTCDGQPAPPPILDAPGQSSTGVGLDGAYGVALSPDGKNVYVSGYLGKSVKAFQRDAVTGALTPIQNFTNVILNSLNGARLLVVSPDGKNVYIASQIGGGNPGGGAFVVLTRDLATGMLGPKEEILSTGEPGLAGAYGVVISADGRFIYVSGNNNTGTVLVYSRDANNGFVSFVQTISDSDLIGAHGLALSPDGNNLYVTAYATGDTSTGKLVTYKRNAADGKLTHVQTKSECDTFACIFGAGFIDGLGGAYQVAVSPDGLYVYAVGTYDGAVVVFKRSAVDGSLSRVITYKDNTSGIDGLDGVSGVAISPDGKYLFASGYNDKAVAVFERDAASGLLSFAQAVQRTPLSGAGGLPALDGARDIRVSPDGSSVYVAAFVDDAVVALHTANPAPALLSLTPASAQAGGAAFTLTVNGSDFTAGAAIKVGATTHATKFINNTQLSTTVAASEIGSAGQLDISVANPAPGGGASNALKFTITAPNQNPVPSVTTLAPASAAAGGAAFTLTVNGSGFIGSSTVRWNGANRPTSFVSNTRLTAQISAADIAQPGPAGVSVANPAPGGGVSNAATFDISAPGQNPTPSISTVAPAQIMADIVSATDTTLTITGDNFILGSQALWNGASRPTTRISATELRMTITAADLATGGQGSITVVNPGPGGGTSNTATFTVIPIRARIYVPMIRR